MTISKRLLAVAIACSCGVTLSDAMAGSKTNARGLDKANFDESIAACDNFYFHSNGSWLKNNPVPAAYTSWGVFNELNDRNEAILKSILDDTAKGQFADGSNAQKLRDFYASAMDEAGIEKAGYDPIKPDLNKIAKLKSSRDVVNFIQAAHANNNAILFGARAQADLKNSKMTIAYAGQGGLGLPERDYYLRDDADSKALREKYLSHMQKMFQLIGMKPSHAKRDAARVLAFETELAKASLPRVELRDPAKSYNVIAIEVANKLTPQLNWSNYFASQGATAIKTFSFSHPKFFAEINRALKETPMHTWQAYLRWNVLNDAAPALSSAFVNENFAFFNQTLSGQKELKPRWKRSIDAINQNLGDALGEQYVARAFPPEAKAQMQELITNLLASVKTHIENLAWMSADTKKQALQKLSTFTPKIGYPAKWKDYSTMPISKQHVHFNLNAAGQYERRTDMAKVGKPVDPTEWRMNPQTVNAYYNPLQNEIVFPAAILQPPFFDKDADPALNYGGIGAVIGHEIIHGFDDRGSQFDAEGNFKNWWTKEDRAKFEALTKKLGKQFSDYQPLPNLHIKGDLTMGENIADLGGLAMAYDALMMSLQNKRIGLIDGFTQDQRFYLSWSQIWRRTHTPEQLKLMINTDSHSPSQFRVIGPLSNISAFRDSFGCKVGDNMVRSGEDQIVIW